MSIKVPILSEEIAYNKELKQYKIFVTLRPLDPQYKVCTSWACAYDDIYCVSVCWWVLVCVGVCWCVGGCIVQAVCVGVQTKDHHFLVSSSVHKIYQ